MASSIVSSAAKQLGGLLVDEAKYLYVVRDKIEDLQIELEWMECFLEDADNRQHQEKVVQKWVAQIRDFAYDAEDIIQIYLYEVSHHRRKGIWNTFKWFSCCLNDVLTLHSVGSNIDGLKNKISELIRRMQLYGVQVTRQPEISRYNLAVREERRTYSHTEEDPVGLDEHIEKVVDKLANNTEAKVVGISGMGGLGKTTLARKVISNSAIRDRFKNNTIWVYISKEFDRRNIFEEILVGLDSDYGTHGSKSVKELRNDELPQRICETIEKRDCLVVLDDIWTDKAWDTLQPAFQSVKRSGSKILITTRNRGLVQHADPCGYSHPFGFLNDADSWKLLQQKAFLQNASTAVSAGVKTKMEELGKEMLSHCNGLPLAILALGGLLVTRKTLREWEAIHMNLSSYLAGEMGHASGDCGISSVLELSYYDLPFYLKPCFMYLGSFPEDYEIRTQRLYHLWEAEALVTVPNGTRGVTSIDDIAESYLNQLVERCMVQVEKCWPSGRIKSCRLHDTMRDMCIKKCKEVNFLHTLECEGSEKPPNYIVSPSHANRKLRRCAIHSKTGVISDSPFDINLNDDPCIRSLLLFPYRFDEEIYICSPSTWKFFSLVRVLDLQGVDIGNFSRVLGFLIHLRYLSLRDACISDLPLCIWNNCKCLESLDLRFRPVATQCLNNDFSKLERLRHLYLPRFLQLEDPGELIFSQKQIHQLETLKNFDKRCCKVEDLANMVNLRIFTVSVTGQPMDRTDLDALLKSPAIVKEGLINPLRLTVSGNALYEDPTVLRTLGSQACISRLFIAGRMEVCFDVKMFPTTLRSITLFNCEMDPEGVVSELEKLPHLQTLTLQRGIKGSKISFSDGGFPQLTELFFNFLVDLEDWEVGEGSLPNLKILQIAGCKKLTMLPDWIISSVHIVYAPDAEEEEF